MLAPRVHVPVLLLSPANTRRLSQGRGPLMPNNVVEAKNMLLSAAWYLRGRSRRWVFTDMDAADQDAVRLLDWTRRSMLHREAA